MKTEALSATVVVLGKFAPAMFHPTWFGKLGLLGSLEIESSLESDSLIVSQNIAQFVIGGFNFQIQPDRFQIGTDREDLHAPLRDLLDSTLKVLDATPISSFGINWARVIKADTAEKWHAFGDMLAPKPFWKKHWSGHAGLLSLGMQLKRTDDLEGDINVQIQSLSQPKFGVAVKVNDHYDLKVTKDHDATATATLFSQVWEDSKKHGVSLIDGLEEGLTS